MAIRSSSFISSLGEVYDRTAACQDRRGAGGPRGCGGCSGWARRFLPGPGQAPRAGAARKPGRKPADKGALRDLLNRLRHHLPEAPSTNYSFRAVSPSPYDLLPPRPVIYDIGAKDTRATYAFGAPPKDAKVVCVDIQAGPGVDLVADAENLHMVADGVADCVCVVSMLEHVRHPYRVVGEAWRILKPGGIVYVSVPFVYPFHTDPDDYHRFSYKGVAVLCEDFDVIACGFNRGPASTMHHLLVHFLGLLFSFNSSALYTVNVYVLRWLLFWFKYLDVFLARYRNAHVIHAGAYFVGRKPQPAARA